MEMGLADTLSAISHQIRQLEEMLGVPLFHRTRKGLILSPEGQAILPDLQRGFDYLAQALSRLEARRAEGTLTINMFSTVAMRWFIPRLARFQAKHPEIDVRITTTMKPVDLEREGLDCAIRYGDGDWPGLAATRLFAEELTVVAHPSLRDSIRQPGDLRGHKLLHSLHRLEHWRIWLQAAGVTDIDPAAGPVFETRSFTIQAAIEGLGVAVMDPAFVAEEIQAGRLVRLFDRTLPVSGAYWLVCLQHMSDAPRLVAMRDWLLEEVAR